MTHRLTPEDGRINVRGAITSALVTTASGTGLRAGAAADRLTDEILRELRGKRRMVLLWLSGDGSEERLHHYKPWSSGVEGKCQTCGLEPQNEIHDLDRGIKKETDDVGN